MYWKKPHISRVYEALTALADGRIELVGNGARCFSKSGEKVFDIKYDPNIGSIMSNDNVAYFAHSISYPMIGYLLLSGRVQFDRKLLELLPNIYWEDIFQKYKNDYDKSLKFVMIELKNNGDDVDYISGEVRKVYDIICGMKIKTFGELQKPNRSR